MASRETVPKGKMRQKYDPLLELPLIGIGPTDPSQPLRTEVSRSSQHKSTIGLRNKSCLVMPIRTPRTLPRFKAL